MAMLDMFCLECRDKVLQRGSETCFSPCPIAEADRGVVHYLLGNRRDCLCGVLKLAPPAATITSLSPTAPRQLLAKICERLG